MICVSRLVFGSCKIPGTENTKSDHTLKSAP